MANNMCFTLKDIQFLHWLKAVCTFDSFVVHCVILQLNCVVNSVYDSGQKYQYITSNIFQLLYNLVKTNNTISEVIYKK